MSRSSVLKITAAILVLAIVLIFLGVNFVPQISALTPGSEALSKAVTVARIDLERIPIGAGEISKYLGSDWVERNASSYYGGSDWIERNASNYYGGSDWIERQSSDD
jgi:hypothetical protein